MVKNLPANVGDTRDIQSLSWEEMGMATHSSYSCLENPMDRGDWWAIVYKVTKSRKQLK